MQPIVSQDAGSCSEPLAVKELMHLEKGRTENEQTAYSIFYFILNFPVDPATNS